MNPKNLIKKKLAIFASGSGTNAENIIKYFRGHDQIEVALVLSNKAGAGVLQRARSAGVPAVVFNRKDLYESGRVMNILKNNDIACIVLAGFLWLIPEELIRNWRGKIVNIHPALLPKYGGKGMYGQRVHETVITNGDKESGITIHHVNENYDEGNIILQKKCPVLKGDTPDRLAGRVHKLEYKYYPKVIEKLCARA